MKVVAIALLILSQSIGSSFADEPIVANQAVNLIVRSPVRNGSIRFRSWHDVVGEHVVAEGLAWGDDDKGLGQRVLLDGGHIYVTGKALPNGRLVRVIGVLRLETQAAAQPGAQGFAKSFKYFSIAADKIEQLNEVESPFLAEP
jgi:hypothetical protein